MADRFPARSKMVDVYLAHTGSCLATGQLDEAERAALSMPAIATALEHEDLLSSAAACRIWCERWATPAPSDSEVADWADRAEWPASVGRVPSESLRRFRLQRLAREIAPTPIPSPIATDSPRASFVERLMQAMRAWYAQQGRTDSVVQTNLGRLGVLR